jgi:hypothetical protein
MPSPAEVNAEASKLDQLDFEGVDGGRERLGVLRGRDERGA